VEQREFKPRKDGFERIKENDLPGHLQNENDREGAKTVKSDELARDYQLNEAFNLLKGLVLFNSPKSESEE